MADNQLNKKLWDDFAKQREELIKTALLEHIKRQILKKENKNA